MPDPARLRAVRRLLRIEEDAAYVSRLSAGASDDAERRAIAIVAGVTRWRRWLDWSVSRHLRQPLASLDAPLRQALRLGAFELIVEGRPPHAAVGEAVGVTRTLLHKGAAGLANAVLRKLAREVGEDRLPRPSTGDAAEDLAIEWSHPTWLVRRWLDRWGAEETKALLAFNNEVPRYTLRSNTLRVSPEQLMERLQQLGTDPEPCRWAPEAFRVVRLAPALGLVSEGACAVQDEAALLVVHALDPQPGEAVLDGAAAPGGKAIAAAERMQNQGRVVAVDVHAGKTDLIWRASQAHGATIVAPVAADLREWETDEPFDRVLLDAPCSGTGVLAKRADLRWNRTPEEMGALAVLQRDLLAAAAAHVRPGGVLVYSTCSLEPEENEGQVEAFLAGHPEFSREPVTTVPEALRTPAGDYQALPHRHGTDGAYAARLRRA
ncbi:MAG TPA: 16S rRNA (cytosine(967)-C(5))-methyltransferase RsmB [Bacteroidetes bacterium]|nr:16S rRNA (cytosine(967)-C(5))-methyltransferase RsmB [Bacteroidota bacterium]